MVKMSNFVTARHEVSSTPLVVNKHNEICNSENYIMHFSSPMDYSLWIIVCLMTDI